MSLRDFLNIFLSDPAPRQKAAITRPVVKKIVAGALAPLCEGIDRENTKRDRKIAKAAEQAAAAAEDAAAARETVEKFVEMARETFRDVIAELLAPHYRYLEEHLGIKPPEIENANEKPSSSSRRRPVPVRNTPPSSSDIKPLPTVANDADNVENACKTKRRASQVARKKANAPQEKRVTLPKKKASATSPAKSKGAKPCRKK
ncbi:MAG: hypothetical protein IKO40_03925 [Kiritimatiellae bacterium]|nr:hypothetical protein [Kiritimatiellia bacterium]